MRGTQTRVGPLPQTSPTTESMDLAESPGRPKTPPLEPTLGDLRLTLQLTASRILGFALIQAARDSESRSSWEA